jgi:hypothetical protein
MDISDDLLLSGFTGGIAAICANIFLYVLNLFITGNNINMPQLTAEIFLNISHNNINLVSGMLGFVWSMAVGGIYSLVYISMLNKTGWNALFLKAIIIIIGSWLAGAGAIMRLLSLAEYVRDEPLSILAFFIAHILFACVLFLLVKNIRKTDDRKSE